MKTKFTVNSNKSFYKDGSFVPIDDGGELFNSKG